MISYNASKQLSQQFLDRVEDNGLHQMVDEPTRGDNILDLVLTGNRDMVDTVTVEENFGTSDHRRTDINIRLPVPRINYEPRKIYLYSKGDYTAFESEARKIDWETTIKGKNIEERWTKFKQEYNKLCDKYIPHKMIKPGQRHKPAWYNYRSVKKAKKQSMGKLQEERSRSRHNKP